MADGDGIPPWVEFVLRQVREQFEGVNQRLDNLVTRDAFVQEQSRVNEKFDAHGRDISETKAALAAEATARVTAEQNLAKERAEDQKDREREAGNRRWMLFGIAASPIVAAIVGWVTAALISAGGGAP